MQLIQLNDIQKEWKGFEHGYFRRFGTPDDALPRSLVYSGNIHYLKRALVNRNISAIVTKPELAEYVVPVHEKTIFLAADPCFSFWKLFNKMVKNGQVGMEMQYGINNSCQIHPTAVVSKKVLLGKNVVVGARAVIGDYTILGDNVEIGPGVVVGAEGLQVVTHGTESIHIRHAGGVRIGQNSKVLANSVVARGLFPEWTEIGENTFIALLVTVGHQSKIGSFCQVSSNVVVGGSSIIEDRVTVGPSATISSSVTIGSEAKIKLGSVVITDIEPGKEVSGNFAGNHLANVKSFLARK